MIPALLLFVWFSAARDVRLFARFGAGYGYGYGYGYGNHAAETGVDSAPIAKSP